MTLWKRGRQYWMDSVVSGERYREPLHTTDWREAKVREKERLAELARRPADPLGEFFGTTRLSHITPEQIAAYQNTRIDPGPSMEARRLGPRTDPDPALEDAGRLA